MVAHLCKSMFIPSQNTSGSHGMPPEARWKAAGAMFVGPLSRIKLRYNAYSIALDELSINSTIGCLLWLYLSSLMYLKSRPQELAKIDKLLSKSP